MIIPLKSVFFNKLIISVNEQKFDLDIGSTDDKIIDIVPNNLSKDIEEIKSLFWNPLEAFHELSSREYCEYVFQQRSASI